MKKAVIGIADTRERADQLLRLLHEGGFRFEDVSLLCPDKHGNFEVAHEHHTKAPEGAVAGVSAGGLVGGTLGALVGIGAIVVPGLGPLIAAGPIIAALSGAAAGAAVGGVTGALVGMGIPEIEAKAYEGKLRTGNILLAVHCNNAEQETMAKRILKDFGARDVDTTSTAVPPKHDRIAPNRSER
jgi:hypothetical protein